MKLEGTRKFLLALGMTLSAGVPAAAQTMPILADPGPKVPASGIKVPDFDVASVKKNNAGNGMMRIQNTADGFNAENVSLKTLIANAYGINQDFIFGTSAWMDSVGFNVDAKVAGPDVERLKGLPWSERRSMLAALLQERFKLTLHHETKTLPVYELLLAKGGLKMKALPPVDKAAEEAKSDDKKRHIGFMTSGPGKYQGEGITIENLAANLESIVERKIIDKTGVDGIYDVDLKWTPVDEPKNNDAGIESGPSIFTALQEQLGLKLQSSKGPVETIVIDHAEMPTEN